MDMLRLFFAVMVVLAHCHDLSLNSAVSWIESVSNSTLAVKGFFVISGFLVFMSCEKSKSTKEYFNKRIRRIYPAYFFVVTTCAILGCFISDWPISRYFGVDFLKFILCNLTFLNFLHPDLPGVFAHQPVNAVNGALWTIKVEVSFYFAVPLICWLIHRFGRIRVISILYVLSAVYFSICDHMYMSTHREIWNLLSKQLPGQLNYFLCGAALYYYFDIFKHYKSIAILLGLGFFAIGLTLDLEYILPIGLSILVISVAFGPFLGNAGRYGDFSYGIYIWHYPIVQTLIAFGLFTASPNLAVGAACVIALAAAVMSWHFIEKPWLFRTSHYVAATQ